MTKKSVAFSLCPDPPFESRKLPSVVAIGDNMSRPESYFSIKKHTIPKKGRAQKDTIDYCLFFEDDVVICPYNWGRYNAQGSKYVRWSTLQDIASWFDSGANDNILKFRFNEEGLESLTSLLASNKIQLVDFAKWVSDTLEGIDNSDENTSGKQSRPFVKLASIINKHFDQMSNGVPDNKARAEALKELITDKNLQDAVNFLNKKLDENGWNDIKKKTIKQNGVNKDINNPAYGQVMLKK